MNITQVIKASGFDPKVIIKANQLYQPNRQYHGFDTQLTPSDSAKVLNIQKAIAVKVKDAIKFGFEYQHKYCDKTRYGYRAKFYNIEHRLHGDNWFLDQLVVAIARINEESKAAYLGYSVRVEMSSFQYRYNARVKSIIIVIKDLNAMRNY